jgi:hypothetical protein
MVHVPSHSRQRHNVVTVMTFASVSMILPLQNGHTAGRATASANCESRMPSFRFYGAQGVPTDAAANRPGQRSHLGLHEVCWPLFDSSAVQE